jgi:hypothetical protein
MRVLADVTQLFFGNVEAFPAGFQILDIFQIFGKRLDLFRSLLEKMQNQPFGHFGTDGGQGGEVFNQLLE